MPGASSRIDQRHSIEAAPSEPISRSAKQFCHGDPAEIGLSRDNGTVDPVAIADQIAWRLALGECFGNLLRDPLSP